MRQGRGQVQPERALPDGAGAGRRGSESGGCSVRNAVVVSPARSTGWATSQRRNGRFVVTPRTSVSASAVARRSSASSRVSPGGDQLRDHRVVGDADLVALLDAGVHADPVREPQVLEPAGLREERARVLGIEPHLDRVALERGRLGQHAALGELELRGDEVEPGDELRHGMLDLDAPVQLQEEEVAPVEHELGGARASVRDRLREPDGGVAHRRAQLGIEGRGGRLLEHLLVAALDGAFALAERDRAARARRRGAGSRRAAAARRTARRTRCRRRTPPSPRVARPPAPPRARPESGRRASRARPRRPLPSRAAGTRGQPDRPRRARGRPPRGPPASPRACPRRRAAPPATVRRRRGPPPRPLPRNRRSPRGTRSPGGSHLLRSPSLRGCAPRSGGTRRSRPSRRRRACAAIPASSGAATATVAIPSSRQVRKMRAAISPRFATRSLRMPSIPERALLEEGSQPVLALGARPPGRRRARADPPRRRARGRAASPRARRSGRRRGCRRRCARSPRRDRRRPRRRGRSAAPSLRRSARR